MTVDVTELTAIERDAFAEIANMGVSRAATSLRQMLGEQVLLSVPAVQNGNVCDIGGYQRSTRPARAR